MAEGFDESKTEAPTPRRREKAREEGQVVLSSDFNGALVLLLTAVAAMWFVPTLASQMQVMLRTRVLELDGGAWSAGATVVSVKWFLATLWSMAGGACLCLLGMNLLISQLQTGFLLTTKPLSPNWEKLSPVKGFQRLWSLESLVRGLLAAVKVSTLSAIAVTLMMSWLDELQANSLGSLSHSVEFGWSLIRRMMLSLSGAAVVWGLADFGFRWFRNEQKLKMTREEIKDEQKEDSGHPQLRARIRKMQKEAAQRRTLRDVPKATVVITNPTHFAVALRYESGVMKAPKVVAKGSGAFARQIMALARKNGVPVIERKPLARALYALADVGHEIPMELYRAVAEILAQVYRLKNAS